MPSTVDLGDYTFYLIVSNDLMFTALTQFNVKVIGSEKDTQKPSLNIT